MPSIQIDDQTGKALSVLAASQGMTLEEYVQELLARHLPLQNHPITPEEFDTELEALSIDGPSLPPDFSRADIYSDHD